MGRRGQAYPTVLGAMLLLAGLGCAHRYGEKARQHRTPPASRCLPQFPYRDGWLGGDAAYSIPLGPHTSLWLFGDTFVQSSDRIQRQGATMVANSIGRSTCAGGHFAVTYAFGGSRHAPRPYFETGATSYGFWPLDGTSVGGVVYAFLARVHKGTTGPFDFRYVGVSLARLVPTAADPALWRRTIVPLVDSRAAFPGVAVARRGPYLYMFTVLDDAPHKQRHPMLLTRLPLSALADPAGHLETFADNGTWLPGLLPKKGRIVMPSGATEMSVAPAPGGGWVAIFPRPGGLTRDAVFSTAPRLEGPWSAPRRAFAYPPLAEPHPDSHIFCYAAKEHAELRWHSADGGLRAVATYVCNSLDFHQLTTDLTLYRPRVVVLPLSQPGCVSKNGSLSGACGSEGPP